MSGSSSDPAVDVSSVEDEVSAAHPPEATGDGQNSDDKGAPSTPEGEKPSMLDAVKTALKPKADASPASQAPDQKPEADDPEKDTKDPAEDDAKDPSEEEKKHWSPRTQRRFRKLNADVNARDQLLEQIRPKAEEFDKLDQFVRSSGLSSQDVQGTLRIAAQMRSDPMGAYNALLPLMAQLEETIGHVLPPALQQRVASGQIAQEDALALNRAQAQAQLTDRQLQEHRASQEQLQRRQTAQDQVNRSVQSVETWEQQRKTSDPDWHLKHDDIRNAVELTVSRKRLADPSWIPTPEEALALSQDAEKQVTARMKQFIPRPAPLPRQSAGGASPRSQTEPATLIEAMKASIRK